jgi:hypothetical protein
MKKKAVYNKQEYEQREVSSNYSRLNHIYCSHPSYFLTCAAQIIIKPDYKPFVSMERDSKSRSALHNKWRVWSIFVASLLVHQRQIGF